MTYQGTIQNGVVVFPHGIHLPEGATVSVQLKPQPSDHPPAKLDPNQLDPVFRMGELAVETGVPDLGVNINHYLYGHSKVDNGP